MFKNKKLLSFLLSTTLIWNLLPGCNLKNKEEVNNAPTLVTSSDSNDTFDYNYHNRNYTFDNNGVTMSFIKRDSISELDVKDWIKYDLYCDPYDKNIKYPESFIGWNWAEEGEKVKIRIPKEAYGFGNNIGIFISEDLGNINWNKILMIYDFVYINCMDFKDDSYDSKFEEVVKICDEKDIPYGLVFTLDMSQYEDPIVGVDDSKKAKKILGKYNESLPTILKIEEKEISDDLKNNPSSYGIYDFINGENNYRGLSNSRKYLINFLNYFHSSHSAFFLQADSETLFHIEEFEKKYFLPDENESLLRDEVMSLCSSYNINDKDAILGYYDNVYRDADDNQYEITNYIVTDQYDESFLNINEMVKEEYNKLFLKIAGSIFAINGGAILGGYAFCKRRRKSTKEKGYLKKK